MRHPAAIDRIVPAFGGLAAYAAMIVLLASPIMAAAPRPGPRRVIPAGGLVAYLEFDGLAAHADAWQGTAAHAMLARTTAGAMIEEVARQVGDRVLRMVPGTRVSGADLIALQDHLAHQGFAIAIHRHRDEMDSWTIVLNGMGRPGMRERFDRLIEPLVAPAPPAKRPDPVRLRERSVFRLPVAPKADPAGPALDRLSWWFENDDLVMIWLPEADSAGVPDPDRRRRASRIRADHFNAVVDAIERKRPDASTHPAYVAAASEGGEIEGFEADGLFFFEAGPRGGLLGSFLEGLGGPDVLRGITGAVPVVGEERFNSTPLELEPIEAKVPFGVERSAPAVDPPGRLVSTDGQPPAPEPTTPPPAGDATAPAVVPILPPPTVLATVPSSLPVVPGVGDGLAPIPPGIVPTPPRRDEPRAVEAKKKVVVGPVPALGLDGIKRVVGRWGFQGKALLTDVRIEAPAPRRGLLGLVDQPAFERDRLPAMPRSSASFVVDAVAPAMLYGRLVELAKTLDPDSAALLDRFERATRDATGLRLRQDLLDPIGPTWCVVPVPSAAGEAGGRDEIDPASFALVVGLKDAEAFSKVLDTLAERANQFLRSREGRDGPEANDRGPDRPMLMVERLPAPDRGYRLISPSRLVYWLNDDAQPTILVGRSAFVLAVNPGRAREILAVGSAGTEHWRPAGEVARAFECLPARLTFLAVGDPRTSHVPGLIAGLPVLVQLMGTGLAGVDDPVGTPGPDLLTVFGIPAAGQFRLRIDPGTIPKEEALRAHLFPSVVGASVDDRGIRLIAREAFPMACVGNGGFLKSKVIWTNARGFERKFEVGLKSALGK